jgi:eukaryotic-like serine/threonine-protein kinase
MSRIREFLSELKKRHVYRVAVAYGIVAWFVVQAASIVVPELLLPGWITRALIVLAVLGFPLALVLAWAYDITPAGMQRTPGRRDADAMASPATPGSATQGGAPTTPVRFVLATAAVVMVVGGGIGMYALSRPSLADVPRGDALLAELAAISEAGRYVDAFELARLAAGLGEEVPDSLAWRFTDRLTVLSEPAGALVTWRHAARDTSDAAPDTTWTELGRTPVRGRAVARGDYLVRIAADGYAPAERLASSGLPRAGSPPTAEVQLDVRLLPSGSVPAGMVHVPGGRYQIASRDLQALSATLEDFYVDRHEVSNARYAEFVDAGGYARADYWADLADDVRGDADTVLRRLVDQTGLPAPRAWSGQQSPPGEAQHPVTGVSWYEAAAYCRFRGGRLPTLFEWEKTARDGRIAYTEGVVLPWGYVGPREHVQGRANFNSRGTQPVGSFPFGISPYGAYDMAGNAKEWLRNRSETGRAVTGGSWADPIYVFAEVGSMEATAASPAVGFRCAQPTVPERAAGAQGDDPIRVAVETPVYTPVDAATFAALLSHYHYDRRPLEAALEGRVETASWTRERITYNGPGGARVIAYLFLPKTGRGPYQTVVYVPHTGAFFGDSVAAQAADLLGPLVRAGRAMFTLVMEGMTEREVPPGTTPPATRSVAFRDQMVRHATELRRGLDYLETRNDIDASALAYIAVSWGAGSRLVFAGTDERFRAVVFIGGGIDERVHPTLPEASNINFAPRLRMPKLVLNGREDEEHPWRTRGLALWNLLPEPRELALFDGVGHIPPAELRIPAIRDFLDRRLGDAQRR